MITSLLLFSAILHAFWNALAKADHKTELNIRPMMIIALAVSWLVVPFVTIGSLTLTGTLWAVLAGLFEAGFLITLVRALEKNPLGLAYTIMRGGAMILVWILSILFLGEKISIPAIAGSLFVLLGIAISQLEPGLKIKSDLKWAYLAAVCIGGYHLCYGKSLERGFNPAFLFAFTQLISVPIFLGRRFFNNPSQTFERLRERPLLITSGGVICYASFFLFLTALAKSGAGHAITIRNTSIIFAQFFSVLIGDKLLFKHWVGAVVTLLGVTLIAL